MNNIERICKETAAETARVREIAKSIEEATKFAQHVRKATKPKPEHCVIPFR